MIHVEWPDKIQDLPTDLRQYWSIRSYGLAEQAVKHIKPIINKALMSKQDADRVVLNIRATPISAQLPSQGELLCGHTPATLLPRCSNLALKISAKHWRTKGR